MIYILRNFCIYCPYILLAEAAKNSSSNPVDKQKMIILILQKVALYSTCMEFRHSKVFLAGKKSAEGKKMHNMQVRSFPPRDKVQKSGFHF